MRGVRLRAGAGLRAGKEMQVRAQTKSRTIFTLSFYLGETEARRGKMGHDAPSSSGFCSQLGLICPQSVLVSELSDQRPLDLSNSLVEPGTSAIPVLVMGGHQGPRGPDGCHKRKRQQ